jgi:hypothetical protein
LREGTEVDRHDWVWRFQESTRVAPSIATA